jgi:hypothetical protein
VANTLATPSWTTKEVARGFINKLVFLANVNRTYDSQYEIAGAKVGNTVNARLPQRFTVTDGQALQLQNLYDQTVPISLTNQKNVAFGYSSQQATTELDNIRARYVEPGSEALANAAEVLAFQCGLPRHLQCGGHARHHAERDHHLPAGRRQADRPLDPAQGSRGCAGSAGDVHAGEYDQFAVQPHGHHLGELRRGHVWAQAVGRR